MRLTVFRIIRRGLIAALLVLPLHANGQTLTVQGRLLTSTNEPLIQTNVEMRVRVYTDDSSHCVLYEETHPNLDLSVSNGLFTISLNSGSFTGAAPRGFTLETALSNRRPLNIAGANCDAGLPVLYSPGPTSTRKIAIAFRPTPGASFEEIPDLELSPSPYAMEARTVGGFPTSAVLRVANGAAPGTPGTAPVLTDAEAAELKLLAGGASTKYVPVASDGIAQVPAPSTPPSVTPPVGSMWFDTATGKLKYVDGGGVQTVGAASGGGAPSGAAGGDLYGTYPNPGVGRIQGRGVAGTAPLGGQVFKYDAGSVNLWTPSYFSIGDLRSTTGTPQFGSATCAAGSTLTWSSVTDTFSCTPISITKSQVSDFPALGSAAALTAGTAAGNVPVLDAGGKILASVLPASAASPWLSGALGELYYSGSNVGIGTSSPGAPLDVRGAIRLSGATSGYTGFQPATNAGSTVWTLPTTDGAADQVLKTDGAGNLGWYTPAGSGISTISGTAPLAASTTSGTTTISLPAASASADGYLTSAKWTEFTNKLSAVAGSALTTANIWVGNGSNQATAVPLSGDATLASNGALTVTKLQGTGISTTAPTDGHVLKFVNASNEWQPGSLSIGDLKTALGAPQFTSATCPASSTLVWSSVTDTFSCQAISITKAQVSDFPALGSASALTAGTAAGNVPVLDAGGKLLASLLPPGSATQWADAGSGNIHYSAGNVGIGVPSPGSKLHVSDLNRTDTATSTQFSSQFLTSLRPTADSDTSITGTRMQLDTQSGVAINHTNILAASTSRANYNGTGTASYVYGSYGISSNASTGTISTSRGAYNRSINIGAGSMGISSGAFNLSDNTGTGTMTSSYGSYSISSNGASGSIANSFGAYNRVHNVSTGGITSAFGHRSQIYNESTGTIGSAYGAYVELLNASGTVNNWYGLYIADAGTNPSYYSLYTSGTTKSYFGGNVGFGVNAPATAVDINGALSHRGIATASAPAVAPSSQGRIYYDSTLNQFMVSQNGGAYVPLSTNGSGSQTFSGPVTMNGAGTSLAVTNNQTVGGTLSVGGATSVTNTTASTSSTTGALRVSGGLGVAGDIFAGASVNASTLMRTPQIYGSSAAGGTLRLDGTSDSVKGDLLLNSSGGNVGIGTSLPAGPFNVLAAGNTYPSFDSYTAAGPTGTGLLFRHARGTSAAPTASQTGDQLGFLGARGYGTTAFSANSSGGVIMNAAENFTDAAQGTNLSLWTTPTGSVTRQLRMMITSAGNVGIGTASPGSPLHVQRNGTTNPTLDGQSLATFSSTASVGSSSVLNLIAGSTGSTGQAILNFGDADSASAGQILYRNADNSMAFHTNSSERVRILNNGNVGIGTIAPTATLDVAGTIKATSFDGSISGSGTLNMSPTVTATSGVNTPVGSTVTYSPSDATSAGTVVRGLYGAAQTGSANNLSNADLRGVQGSINVTSASPNVLDHAAALYGYLTNGGTGTINRAAGVSATITNGSTGSINTATGVSVALSNGGGGTIVNGYGIFIANIQATNKWSIYASDASAPSYFAGSIGIGTSNPTAALHLKAGTATAGTAPLKFTSGTLLTPLEDGAVEYDGTSLFLTSGGVRRRLASTSATNDYSGVGSITGSNALSITAGGTNQNLTLAGSGTGQVVSSSALNVTNATASTSPTTGALTVAGGLGVSGAINSGSTISAATSMRTPQIFGSSAASGTLRLDGTSDATKGNVLLNSAGGNVGIGTSSPASTLNIGPGNGIASGLRFGRTASAGYHYSIYEQTVSTGAIQNSLVIDGNGDTDYRQLLGTNNGSGNIVFTTGAGTAIGGTGASTEKMRITSNGNVGIGTSAPTWALTNSSATNFTAQAHGGLAGAKSFVWEHLASDPTSGFTSAIVNSLDATSANGLLVKTTNTGSGTMALTVNSGGTDRFLVRGDGLVGIGTTTPQNILDVYASNSGTNINGATAQIRNGGAGDAIATWLVPGRRWSAGIDQTDGAKWKLATTGAAPAWGTDTKLTVDIGGNVGIGTSSPVGPLHVYSAGYAAIDRVTTGATGGHMLLRRAKGTLSAPTAVGINESLGRVSFSGYDGAAWSIAAASSIEALSTEAWTPTAQGSAITFATTPNTTVAQTERMRIDQNGNVGIGTSTPTYPLDVISTASPIIRVGRANATGGSIYLGNPSHGLVRDYNGVTNDVGLYTTGGDLQFSAANSSYSQMTIKNSGNVGIGTSAAPGKLTISGANGNITTGTPLLRLNDVTTSQYFGIDNGSAGNAFRLINPSGPLEIQAGANSNHIMLATDGRVGLGVGTPLAKLHVGGNLRVDTLSAATATHLCIDANNVLAACSSSIRYKENVATLDPALDMLLKLRPVTYDWKKSRQHDVGFIAEEVEAVDRRYVTYNKENQIQGVKYEQLTAPIVRAIQELYHSLSGTQADVAALKQENARLKAETEAQKRENAAMKARLDRLERKLSSH